MQDAGGVHPQEFPGPPALVSVEFPVDLLLQLVADGIDTVSEKAVVGVAGGLHLAVYQNGRDEKGPGGKVENILHQGLDVPGIPLHSGLPAAHIAVLVPVELRQNRTVTLQKRLYLVLNYLMESFLKFCIALGQMPNMNLPVLAVFPQTGFHCCIHHLVIALVQTIGHRL